MVSPNFSVEVYASTDFTTLFENENQIDSQSCVALEPSESTNIVTTVDGTRLEHGTYLFGWKIIADGEQNQGNNTFICGPYTIQKASLSAPESIQYEVDGIAVNVSWQGVENAEKYELQYKLTDETDWTSMVVTGTSATFNGEPGGTYDVRVQALGNANFNPSDFGELVDEYPSIDINAPTVFRSTVKVTWKASAEAESTSMILFFSLATLVKMPKRQIM